MSVLLFSGCSSDPVTSSDEPDLRCEKLPDFDSSAAFWKYAYKNIPTVKYSDVISGDYNSSYICIDGLVLSSNVELLIAFPVESDEYMDKGFLTSDAFGDDLVEENEIKAGSSVKICVGISGGDMLYSVLGIQKINTEYDLDIKEYLEERNEKLSAESYVDDSLTEESIAETSSVNEKSNSAVSSSAPEEASAASKPVPYSLEYGDLLDANPSGGSNMNTLIIKAKIEANLTNRLTITQNYQNVIKMVQSGDYASYDEIQYWAVADMADGSEGKVISFTVDKSVVEAIVAGTIASGDTLEGYLTDLWILPSLQE